MARNPIYPTSAGQTAVDRLLNQTLPRIIQDKQARDERAQQRQDTLDARKQQQDNYEQNYDYTIKRDLKNDQIRKEDKIIKLLAQASSSSNAGNLEDSMMYMNQAKFISQKDGTDLEGGGYSAQL